MQGASTIRFSDLFSDTLAAHGECFCWFHYVKRGGMAEWEFAFWLKATRSA